MLKSRGSLLCTQRYVSIFQLLRKANGERVNCENTFLVDLQDLIFLALARNHTVKSA